MGPRQSGEIHCWTYSLLFLPMDERITEATSGTWIGGWTLNKKMLAKTRGWNIHNLIYPNKRLAAKRSTPSAYSIWKGINVSMGDLTVHSRSECSDIVISKWMLGWICWSSFDSEDRYLGPTPGARQDSINMWGERRAKEAWTKRYNNNPKRIG